MKIKTLLTLTAALLLVGCNKGDEPGNTEPVTPPDPTEKYDDFQMLVYRSITNGINKEATFEIEFKGEHLNEDGSHKDYYNNFTNLFSRKGDILTISKKNSTDPDAMLDYGKDTVYQYNSETSQYDLTEQKAKDYNPMTSNSTYGVYHYSFGMYIGYYAFSSDYAPKDVTHEDNKYSYTHPRSDHSYVLSYSDHDGVDMVDDIYFKEPFNATTILHYYLRIRSYTATVPEI